MKEKIKSPLGFTKKKQSEYKSILCVHFYVSNQISFDVADRIEEALERANFKLFKLKISTPKEDGECSLEMASFVYVDYTFAKDICMAELKGDFLCVYATNETGVTWKL